MIYSLRLMDKTVLSGIFAILCGVSAFAEGSFEPSILPADGKVEIWSNSAAGEVESPAIKITNVTNHCTVNASEIGKQEWIALHLFLDKQRKPKIVQVVSALFDNCRLYFGRIRSLAPEDLPRNDTPSVLLGNLKIISSSQMEVTYDDPSFKPTMIQLSRQVFDSPSLLSQLSSLVLVEAPRR